MPCRPLPPSTVLCAAILLLAGAAMPATRAQAATIYRCTDAAGHLTVQNLPCPAGTTQREQRIQDLASPAPAAPSPMPPAPQSGPPPAPEAPPPPITTTPPVQATGRGEFVTTSTGPEPRILDSATLPRTPDPAATPDPQRPPPPPLFRCTTYDNDSYLSEEAEAPPRCLPLRTVGLDGNPAGGAGQACEVVRDQCARVPDDEACDAWRRHAREAGTRWRFAHPDNIEHRRDEYERLAKIVGESCGGPP